MRAVAARNMFTLSLFALVTLVSANMYDVLEPTKVPPTICASGCAAWDSLNVTGL